MSEQWYNKKALLEDLTSITGRKIHSNSVNPVFKTPPVLSINQDQDNNELNLRFGVDIDSRDYERDMKDSDSAMFNFIPDMLSMVRDYEEMSSCIEQPLEDGSQKLVISKLNPTLREFVPRTSPMLVKNDNFLKKPAEIKNLLPISVNNKNKSEFYAAPKKTCEVNGVLDENRKLNKRPEAKCELKGVPEEKRKFNGVPEANGVPNAKFKLNAGPESKSKLIVVREAKCLLTGEPETKCKLNEEPLKDTKHSGSKKKRILNVALTNLSKLHLISKEMSKKAAVTVPEPERELEPGPKPEPLKLLSPDYYMNNKHVEIKPKDGGEVENDKVVENVVKTSIEKVTNWLNVQQEDSSGNSTPNVRSKNNSPKPSGPFEPIVYKKKIVTVPNKESTVPSPRNTPTIVRTKKFVPSQTSEEYYKTFCERNERKAMASHNIWDRVEAELKKRDEIKRREASQVTSGETSS